MIEAVACEKSPRPRRRHIRVRTLLLLIAVLGLLFAWPGRRVFRWLQGRQTVSAIRAHGGIAHEADGGIGLVLRDPGDLRRLSALDGAIAIDLAMSGTDDQALVRLRDVADRLVFLNLTDCPITDKGLANLAGAKDLRVLFLAGTAITDAGLAHLSNLTSLENLVLQDTEITDAGLVHLRSLNKLREIILWKTGVTDTGAMTLNGLPSLRLIDLPTSGEAESRPPGIRPGITVVRQKVVIPRS